jgi:hypothetical protein
MRACAVPTATLPRSSTFTASSNKNKQTVLTYISHVPVRSRVEAACGVTYQALRALRFVFP